LVHVLLKSCRLTRHPGGGAVEGPYRKARGTVTGQILPEPPSGSDASFTVDLD
jgi:hypothetical protein